MKNIILLVYLICPLANADSGDMIVKFPHISEADVPQIVDSLPAPQLKVNYALDMDNAGNKKLEVIDAEGVSVIDPDGRMANAVIPAGAQLHTVSSDEEAKAHSGNWVLVIGKAILNSASIGVGMTKVERMPTSIWWQEGLPYHMKLISPSGDIQFSVKAKSIGFLSHLNNRVINNMSLNIGYFYYGNFSSDAQATSSGYDNFRTYPVYQWTGNGYAEGVYISLQEELPHGFYVAAGVIKYKNHWKMVVHQATCEGNLDCPKLDSQTVYDANGSFLGPRFTIGKHIGKHGSIEFDVDSAGDSNWAIKNGIPPIWHKQAYTLEYRFRR